MRDALNTARTRRYTIGQIITGKRVRTADDVAAIAAFVAAASLTSISGSTFGLFDSPTADDSCAITSGAATLTSANNPWAAGDVGKAIDVQGAGAAGATLRSRIKTYNSAGSVDLWDNAGTTVAPTSSSAGGLAVWGNDLNVTSALPVNTNEAGTSELAKRVGSIVATGSPTLRAIADRLADTVNVKDYGALGDGVTDDTAAILLAIGTGNRQVIFPPGTYYTAQSNGINVLVSDVDLVFSRGASIKVAPNCAGITLARASNCTINRIGIYGARIIATDSVSVNTGIRIAPDATNIANFVTIADCIIDGMGQYGIVIASLSGGASHLTIVRTKVLNNGSTVGTHGRNGLILNPSVASASHDLVIDDVYVEQTGDSGAGSYETDACKIQNYTNVMVTNYTAKGGGGTGISGNTLVFNNCTYLVASNLLVICTGGGGLQLDTSATGIHEITGVNVFGTIGGNGAVILATNGSNRLSLRGLATAGALVMIGTHERMEITDCVFDLGIDTSGGTAFNNGLIARNTCRAAIYAKGNSNIIRENISLSSSTYVARVAGNANIIDGNWAFAPTNGHVQVISGTSNLIGSMHGDDRSIVDAGTTTKRQPANTSHVGAIGTYAGGNPGATTPDVTGINVMRIANSGATSITNFLGGVQGQRLLLYFADANTTITRNNCTLSGGANFVSTADDSLELLCISGGGTPAWQEVCRSVNS